MKSKIIGQGYNLDENISAAKELIELFDSGKYDKFTCLVAFASYGGVTALAPHILRAKTNDVKIKIILGIDQKCTSKEALEEVLSWGVDSYIYYTLNTNIFHPKVYLFENSDYYTLIVGSNNLTEGGLVRNVECSLLVQDMQGTSVHSAFYDYWKGILDSTEDNLYAITQELIEQLYEEKIIPSDNERAMASAEKRAAVSSESKRLSIFKSYGVQKNPEGFEPKRLKRKIKTKKTAVLDDATKSTKVIETPVEIGEEVLIAEIGGGPRWKQVNFPIAIFEEFFGAERGNNDYWISIMNIGQDGSLGDVEKRQAVSVKSRNYRFEIHCEETKGEYPGDSARPIVIFVKLDCDEFLYHVLLAKHDAYEKVKKYLYRESKNKAHELKRAIVHVEAIHALYPELVI